MRYKEKALFCFFLFFTCFNTHAMSPLPTRAQTPLLQSYFIPAAPNTNHQSGWSVAQALYITNTYQVDNSSNENLIIDVENTRFDLQINYRKELWHFNLNIPFINNRAGFLDQSIDGWHDTFALPQGGRDNALNDQINLHYDRSGNVIIDTQQPSGGVGDIQLAAGYQLTPTSQLWFGLELPSSSSSEFISNQSIDFALWYSLTTDSTTKRFFAYTTLGISFPADSGLLKGLVNSQFGFAQIGLNYSFTPSIALILQSDIHTPIVSDSKLDALGVSFQTQFGLSFPTLFEQHMLELFFSEDVLPGHAPDITFGFRVYPFQKSVLD